MKRVFIVNPESGKRKGIKIGEEIKKICVDNCYDYDIYYTKHPLDATDIAKLYKDGENIIYSVGGDGTNLEVLNGVIHTNNFLSFIPCGSGNDFYEMISKKDDSVFLSDVGCVNGTYFLNVASVGIDAMVANCTTVLRDSLIPVRLRYKYALASSFIDYKPITVNVSSNMFCDSGEYTLIAVCNGSQYGNGFKIAPFASIEDGMFDVFIVGNLTKMKMITPILKLSNGTHQDLECVKSYMVDSLNISSGNDLICNLDGEIIVSKNLDFSVEKSAIKIYNEDDKIKQLVKKIKR